jgi:hypothetical protein
VAAAARSSASSARAEIGSFRAQRLGDRAGVVLPGVLDLELEVPLGPVRGGRTVHRPLLALDVAGILRAARRTELEVGAGAFDVRHEADRVLAAQLQQLRQPGQGRPAGELALRPPGQTNGG